MNKLKKHRSEIVWGLVVIFLVLCATCFKNKQIVFRSPVLIETISPASDNWAEVKMNEMIQEALEERPVSELGETGAVIDTQLVADHSQRHPGVYSKIKQYFGDKAKVVGELLAHESSMNPLAVNPTSGACGLFQALPCKKLGCELSDVDCQMEWGKSYIEGRYGTPENALAFWHRNGWY